MRLKTLYLFIVTFCYSISLHAQNVEDLIPNIEEQPVVITDTLDRVYDTQNIDQRSFDDNLREKYDGKDFTYQQATKSGGANIIERFLSWIMSILQDLFGINLPPWVVKGLTYFFYAVIAAVVIYFIVKFVGKENASSLFGKSLKKGAEIILEDQHIDEIDFNALIKSSEAAGNYRLAVRYQFLNLLKSMSASEKIAWDYQKTNTDYYYELPESALKSGFKDVAYLYDHVWYGEFEINKDSYQQSVNKFKDLNSMAA